MIYNMNDGKIMAGGYSVNSILLNDQQPAMYQKEGGKSKHEKVSDRFKNLAVPAGLLYINESVSENTIINDAKINDAIINDDLYEKLLDLAGPQKSKIETQKHETQKHETQKYEIQKHETQKTKKQTRSKKGKNKKKMTKKNNRK